MKDNKFKILKKYWGHEKFRPLQEEIINQVIQKKDLLALLPTGGGKSICYQLPAILSEGVCLVISPLIALMQDQVLQLQKIGVNAELINSSIDFKHIDRILDNCIYGKVKLLYLSPERIETPLFIERFKKMNVSFVAVDEAHCISEWGNDFRPSYRNISKLKEWNPKISFIALTATATIEVAEDIIKQLQFSNKNILKKSFLRENIKYQVINCENKNNVLNNVIQKESSIIYVRTRKNAEEIAYYLKSKGKKADFYHAGLKPNERELKQEKWINNEFDIIVATNAFGMGIDKADVRTVIHCDLPESIESFYQESGRAGRDGRSSYSYVLTHSSDGNRLIEKIKSQLPTVEKTKIIFQNFCNYHQVGIGYQSTVNYEVDFEFIAEKSGMSKYETFYIFKQLISEGYLLETSRRNYSSRVKFITGINSINQFLSKYPRFEKIVDLLIRSYSDVLNNPVVISENLLAQRINVINNNIKEQLNELSQFGIIKYMPKRNSYQVQFILPRPDINKLTFAKENLKNHENKIKKAQFVVKFIEDKINCRNKLLLNYFGEEYPGKCDNCDNCTKNLKEDFNPKKIVMNAIKMTLKYERKSAKSIYLEFHELIEKNTFKNILKELIKEEILSFDDNNLIFLNEV